MDVALLAALSFTGLVGLAAGAGGVATAWLISSLRRHNARQDAALEREHQALLAQERDW